MVKELEIDDKDINDKNSLFFKILDAQARASGKLFAEGVIEVHSEGYGFLRFQEYAYLTSPEDIYVSPSAGEQVRPAHRRHGLGFGPPAQDRGEVLRPADGRSGQLRGPRDVLAKSAATSASRS